MKHNQSVEINHSTKTVILTKKFLLAANRIGTPEFNEMMTLRTQFSDYTFEEREIKKNPNKQTYTVDSFQQLSRPISQQKSECKFH